jgi:drug/metabolite transporter (DMT)-like permease
MYASTKISEDITEVKTHHIILVRSLFTWCGAYVYGKIDSVDFGYEAMSTWPKVVHISLLKRSIYGFAAMMCTFLSVSFMPVSVAVAIMQTTAFVTALMAYLIKDEPLSYKECILILIGVFGCILLTSPDLFITQND